MTPIDPREIAWGVAAALVFYVVVLVLGGIILAALR